MCVFRGTNRTIVGLLTSAIILASVMTGCAGPASNAAAPLNVTAPIPASGQTPSPPPAPNPPPTPNPPTPNPPPSCKLTAFVTNQSSNTVSVIDVATETVTQTISVGTDPRGVAITPDKVYVTNAASDSVSVIDAATDQVTATVAVGNNPIAAAVMPNGRAVYVVNENSNSVSVIDTATNQATATIAVGVNPVAVAIRADGVKAYVSNIGYVVGSPNPNNPPGNVGMVSVIDTATNLVTATIQVSGPGALAVTPDDRFVVLTTEGRNVAVISTDSNTVTRTISLEGLLGDLAVSPDGQFAYVTDGGSFGGLGGSGHFPSAVFVIHIATGQVVGTANEPPGLEGIALTPDGTLAYVTDNEFGGVRVFDTKSRTFTSQVKIGNGLTNPAEVAIACMAK